LKQKAFLSLPEAAVMLPRACYEWS
jgi:hypothetical protein